MGEVLRANDGYASNSFPLLASKSPRSEGVRGGSGTGLPPMRVGCTCPHARRQAYGTPG